VELAHFERIEHGLKNFDLVFVFKDYKKTPVHVNSIPMQQLENVKEWIEYFFSFLFPFHLFLFHKQFQNNFFF